MLRFTVLAILFVAACSGPISDGSDKSTVEESVNEYLAQSPAFELFQELKTEEIDGRVRRKYTFGRRVNSK